MKTLFRRNTQKRQAFTLVEVMIAMSITVLTVGLAIGTILSSLRMFYKDNQRLASNASLRSFMMQISNETLNSSYYYLFDFYTKLDGNISLTADPAGPTKSYDNANDEYDRWVAHGDCLVLVTLTSQYRTTDIRQIRIYYRVTKDQNTTAGQNLNGESELRYYETPDTAGPGQGWGEGTSTTSNGRPATGLVTELNNINLNLNPEIAGSRRINAKTLGRLKPSSTDRYAMFSTLSAMASPTSGSISMNVEFVSSGNLRSSSSSFNYTISPRK